MTNRPIIFSAPMVRALLDGTKTQTRRLLNPQPTAEAAAIRQIATDKAPHGIIVHPSLYEELKRELEK